MGIFAPFIDDQNVKLIGVEAAGRGIETGQHAAALVAGRMGVLHGAKTYILQDQNGQIQEAYSISAGLDYPGVGPEHSNLKDLERVEYQSVTDNEALEATRMLSQYEGILPALETAHAVAYLNYLMPKTTKDEIVIVNISGRGDKDLNTIIKNINL